MVGNGVLNYDSVIANTRTQTVLQAISPLIEEITTITEYDFQEQRHSHDGQTLLENFRHSFDDFVQTAVYVVQQCPIVSSLPDMRVDLDQDITNVEICGERFLSTAAEFVQDSSDSARRDKIIMEGRDLLQKMCTLIIKSDMIEVCKLNDQIEKMRRSAKDMTQTDSNQTVTECYEKMEVEMEVLTELTRRRVHDLRFPADRDDMMAAYATIKATAPVYFAATKAFIRHPDQESALRLRNNAYTAMDSALSELANVTHNGAATDSSAQQSGYGREHYGSLADALDNFQNRVIMDPMAYRSKHRHELEGFLEDIVTQSGRVAEEYSTRDGRKAQIIDGCNKLRQALQDLLTQYETYRPTDSNDEELDLQIVLVNREVKDLRRHLRRAVVDAVSDAFLDTRSPIHMLICAARDGDVEGFEQAKTIFSDHTQQMLHAAELVCEMSLNQEANRTIRYACEYIRRLEPQVIDAANLLLAQPDSKIAQENMAMFESTWLDKVHLLTCAVDANINVDDFIAVSENHITHDAQIGISAIYNRRRDTVDHLAGAIRGRSLRICDVVEGEYDELSASPYFEDIRTATKRLRNNAAALNTFAKHAEQAIQKIPASADADIDDRELGAITQEMIEACGSVNDAVLEIRHALLKSRHLDDIDSDNEYEEDGATTVAPSHISDGENQQRLMRRLPEECKEKIQEKIEIFKITQQKFEHEVGRWDDSGNEIITLATHMVMLMKNMTEFQRGSGPYKTSQNIIDASQEISESGKRLIALAKDVAKDCVESQTKTDLDGYLEQIEMLSTQLSIISKVKADIEVNGDEIIVGNLDSITSLVENAKNLLNAVMKTVKSVYIASTKCSKRCGQLKDQAIALQSLATHNESDEDVPETWNATD